MAHGITFYQSVPVRVNNKDGTWEWGDVPCVDYNPITKQFLPVVNNRGKGYAGRNRLKYRNKKKD